MKRFILICFLIFGLVKPVSAISLIGSGIVGAGGGTTYLSKTFEGWSDLTGFDSTDQDPANQMLLDTNSICTGINSILQSSQAVGGTEGSFNFAQTDFYASMQIYISSSSAPENADGIYVGGAWDESVNNMFLWFLYYQTDHYEVSFRYRNDAATLVYFHGNVNLGNTITADALHTLYIRIIGGGAGTGEVWFAVDAGAWEKATGLTIATKASNITKFSTAQMGFYGTKDAGDWVYYTDNLWAGDYDPK